MNKTITNLNDAIEASIKATKSRSEYADFDIKVENEIWHCYEVSISNRDVLCLCDKGVATYLVDSYGEKHVAELYNWNKE